MAISKGTGEDLKRYSQASSSRQASFSQQSAVDDGISLHSSARWSMTDLGEMGIAANAKRKHRAEEPTDGRPLS